MTLTNLTDRTRAARSPQARWFAALIVLALLWPSTGLAEPWTLDDLVTAQTSRQLAMSADGTIAAWVVNSVAEIEGEEKAVSHLWMRRLGEDPNASDSIQLTRGHERVLAFGFSPDAKHLAFTSTRKVPGGDKEMGPQLWLLPTSGGEAFPITRFDRGVNDFAWIDNSSLLATREESPSAWEAAREEENDTTIAVEDPLYHPPIRLFRVGIDGESKRLGKNNDWIDALAVSPDGRHAAITAQQSLSYEFDNKVPPHTFLVDLESGERQRILEDTNLLPRELRWSTDSRHLYFIDDFTNHPIYRNATVSHLHRYDTQNGQIERVDFDWPRGLRDAAHVTTDGLVTLLFDGVYVKPARLDQDGTRRDLEGEHVRHIQTLAVSRDGKRVLYVSSTANRPPRVFAARLYGATLASVGACGSSHWATPRSMFNWRRAR